MKKIFLVSLTLVITFLISNEVKAQGMCYSVKNASLSIVNGSGSDYQYKYVAVQNHNKNAVYVSCEVYGLNSDGDWEYAGALYGKKVSSNAQDEFYICKDKYTNYKLKEIDIQACTDDK